MCGEGAGRSERQLALCHTLYDVMFSIGKLCEDGRIASITAAFKKGKKEGLHNPRPVPLLFHPGEVME